MPYGTWINVDNVTLLVDGFLHKDRRKCKHYILSHFHADHTQGLDADFNHGLIYATPCTAELIVRLTGVRESFLHQSCREAILDVDNITPSRAHPQRRLALPHNEDAEAATRITGSAEVADVAFNTGKAKGAGNKNIRSARTRQAFLGREIHVEDEVYLTFLDANHCPGAAIVFVYSRKSGKCVLHTGDFRGAKVVQDDCARWLGERKDWIPKVETLYLDNTYCKPRFQFPDLQLVFEKTREYCRELFDTISRAARAAKEDEAEGMDGKTGSVLVLIGTYSIGKENFVQAVHDGFNNSRVLGQNDIGGSKSASSPVDPVKIQSPYRWRLQKIVRKHYREEFGTLFRGPTSSASTCQKTKKIGLAGDVDELCNQHGSSVTFELHTTRLEALSFDKLAKFYLHNPTEDSKFGCDKKKRVIRVDADYLLESKTTGVVAEDRGRSKDPPPGGGHDLVERGSSAASSSSSCSSISCAIGGQGSNMGVDPTTKTISRVLSVDDDVKVSEEEGNADGDEGIEHEQFEGFPEKAVGAGALRPVVNTVTVTEESQDEGHVQQEQDKKKYDRVIAFRPTGWTWSNKERNVIKEFTSKDGRITIAHCAYSEHSSFLELQQFVNVINANSVLPTVPDDTLDMKKFLSYFTSEADRCNGSKAKAAATSSGATAKKPKAKAKQAGGRKVGSAKAAAEKQKDAAGAKMLESFFVNPVSNQNHDAQMKSGTGATSSTSTAVEKMEMRLVPFASTQAKPKLEAMPASQPSAKKHQGGDKIIASPGQTSTSSKMKKQKTPKKASSVAAATGHKAPALAAAANLSSAIIESVNREQTSAEKGAANRLANEPAAQSAGPQLGRKQLKISDFFKTQSSPECQARRLREQKELERRGEAPLQYLPPTPKSEEREPVAKRRKIEYDVKSRSYVERVEYVEVGPTRKVFASKPKNDNALPEMKLTEVERDRVVIELSDSSESDKDMMQEKDAGDAAKMEAKSKNKEHVASASQIRPPQAPAALSPSQPHQTTPVSPDRDDVIDLSSSCLSLSSPSPEKGKASAAPSLKMAVAPVAAAAAPPPARTAPCSSKDNKTATTAAAAALGHPTATATTATASTGPASFWNYYIQTGGWGSGSSSSASTTSAAMVVSKTDHLESSSFSVTGYLASEEGRNHFPNLYSPEHNNSSSTSSSIKDRPKRPNIPMSFAARALTLAEESKNTGKGSNKKRSVILTNFFRTILKVNQQDLVHAVYFILSKISPEYENLEVGVGSASILKTISTVLSTTPDALTQLVKDNKAEDLGEAALIMRMRQPKFFASTTTKNSAGNTLSIKRVVTDVREKVAKTSGKNSLKTKLDVMQKLLALASRDEVKYLIRFLENNMRIGIKSATVLQCLAHAFVWERLVDRREPEPSAGSNSKQEELRQVELQHPPIDPVFADEVLTLVEVTFRRCFSEYPSYDRLVEVFLEALQQQDGTEDAPPRHAVGDDKNVVSYFHNICEQHFASRCTITRGIPVKPMLANPARALQELTTRFQRNKIGAEFKYDGERAQIHIFRRRAGATTKQNKAPTAAAAAQMAILRVEIFSRRCEKMTERYPDVVQTIEKNLREDVEEAIFECEVVPVAVDVATGATGTAALARSSEEQQEPLLASDFIQTADAKRTTETNTGEEVDHRGVELVPNRSAAATNVKFPTTFKLLPFQKLSTRGRKDVQLKDVKVPVCLFMFDLLLLNGEVMARKDLRTRQKFLAERIFRKTCENSEKNGCYTYTDETVADEFLSQPIVPQKIHVVAPEEFQLVGGEQHIHNQNSEGLVAEDEPSAEVEGTTKTKTSIVVSNKADSTPPSRAEGQMNVTAFAERNDQRLNELLNLSVKNGCEGLMLKSFQSTYESSKRSYEWLKLKKDYIESTGDTLDVTVVGVFYGNGRRAGWFGSFLLAVRAGSGDEKRASIAIETDRILRHQMVGDTEEGYDDQEGPCPDDDVQMNGDETSVPSCSIRYQTLSKCMSGFTDKELIRMREVFSAKILPEKPAYVDCSMNPTIVPDEWIEPCEVWEVKGADFQKSPAHTAGGPLPAGLDAGGTAGTTGVRNAADESAKRTDPDVDMVEAGDPNDDEIDQIDDFYCGIGLRFPRFVRARHDLQLKDIVTGGKILELYKSQATIGASSSGMAGGAVAGDGPKRKTSGSALADVVSEERGNEVVFSRKKLSMTVAASSATGDELKNIQDKQNGDDDHDQDDEDSS
ncbi:unnamed protein product [Amoebophrya sp. A120]|nr:unnamed protein product [Amoebophrya sp. A120]|eukprot:GSA120T00010541001.1